MDLEGANTSASRKEQQHLSTPTYLSFLEKQVEKANRAYLQVDSLRDQIGHIKERVDLVELQSEDVTKKVQIIAAYEGHQINRRAIENLNGRLAEVETTTGKKAASCFPADTAGKGKSESAAAVGQFTDCFFGTQSELEVRVIQAVMERVNTMLSHSEMMIMQKCNQIID